MSSVTETIVDSGPGLGSFEIGLIKETPDSVRAQLGMFGHVVIVDGRVDVEGTGEPLLAGARYVGVLRGRHEAPSYTLSGSGMVFWLGDEDEKSHVIETEVSLTNATLTQAVTAVLPPTVTLGTVYPLADPARRYTGKHLFQSPRKALSIICDAFGVESRVNGNATVDVGRPDQLYAAVPDKIITRRAPGTDVDLVGLAGDFATDQGAWDYTTRVLLLGETTDQGQFATGAANAGSVPYLDLRGNPVKFTRMVSESEENTGSVAARAAVHLNRFNRLTRALKVTAGDFENTTGRRVGDNVWVYDPDTGIVNAANEVYFRGQALHPDAVRVTGSTWRVTEGMTVAFRTQAGLWLDLTPYVTSETGGSDELTVGDLPRSLTRGRDSTIADRVDANAGRGDTPQPPTLLTLSSDAAVDPSTGANTAVVRASWTAPTQNTDNSALVDLAHYLVQWRPQFRAPEWMSTATSLTTIDLQPAVVGFVYDVRVAAVDRFGNQSAWTAVSSITAAKDTTAPGTPADPVVTNFIGQIRAEWNGLDAAGLAMPPDFNRVDVHGGTTAGFTPSAATLVASLSTKGVAYVPAPYGATRYVKLVAYDHAGNASGASAAVAGTAQMVNTPDIANLAVGTAQISDLSVGKLTAGIMSADVTVSGRFGTALTGARREMNAAGFQAWDAANNLIINLDGVSNLLTGILKTAGTGRRIEIGAGGLLGEMHFYAPDGADAFLRAYTEAAGIEAIQFGVQIAGSIGLWNRINYNNDEWASYRSGTHEFFYRTSEQFHILSQVTPQTGSGASVERFRLSSGSSVLRAPNNLANINLFNDHIDMDPGDIDLTGRIEVLNHGIVDANFRSPNLRFWTDNNNVSGAGYFQGILKFFVQSNSTNPRFECRNSDDSDYYAIYASAFTVNSQRENKRDVSALDIAALPKVRGTKAMRYRRSSGVLMQKVDADGRPTEAVEVAESPLQIGLMVEESPPEIVAGDGEGIDLYQMNTLLWAAVQELADDLDAVKRGRP